MFPTVWKAERSFAEYLTSHVAATFLEEVSPVISLLDNPHYYKPFQSLTLIIPQADFGPALLGIRESYCRMSINGFLLIQITHYTLGGIVHSPNNNPACEQVDRNQYPGGQDYS